MHEPPVARRPRRLAFVDGTMRVEARLTRTDDHGTVTGLAGSWAAGAVLVDSDRPLSFDRVTVGRAAIFTTGQRVELPPQRYVNTHSPADHSGSYSVPSEGSAHYCPSHGT